MDSKTKFIEIKLSDEEYTRLKSIAEQKGMSIEFIARMGTFIYLKRLEGKYVRNIVNNELK